MVANRAFERGIAVLAPIGTFGGCTWNPKFADWWCWPIAPNQIRETEMLISRIQSDLEEVAARSRPIPTVLAGFSNGGFMAMRLAGHGPEISGLVVAQAGAPEKFSFDGMRPMPTLLLAARGDEWQYPTMQTLRNTLVSQGWAPEWKEREGPHALQPEDVEAVISFVSRLPALPEGSIPSSRSTSAE
ncbi:hypothetical protein AKJ08_3593 [Vulgatibacter incomptus]|uniref:Phospholipase/carboxylesterase/thioesterase domain-containing protein n=1 Tax=Vulgatibacter incomptus TaxID=1391653 RepID=A0A0K1PIJ3_9BACT|nr:hypothetical protein AKJ08_3593 [Vulgatibacter incomptus]